MEGLGDDSYFLASMRRFKPYMLSEKEEKIVNIKDVTGSSALSNLYDIMTNGFTFKLRVDEKLKSMTQEELTTFVRSPDAKVRKQAYTALLKKYKSNRSALGEIYRSLVLDWQNEGLTLRGYKTSLGMRNLGNDIPDKAVDALLSVCKKNGDVFKEYFNLKNALCGIDNPTRFDLYAPYHDTETKYTFDQAKKIVLDTLGDFSPNMQTLAQEVYDKNHIHSDIQEGKRSGAYCYSMSPSVAPFVMLNFTQTLNDVSTLAHETGHAVHALLARDHSYFTFHSSLPLAETASIFSEMLLTQKLLKTADKATKTSILLRQLDHIYASVGRQAYFVLFEQEAHEAIRNSATLDDLDKIWMNGLRKQFGGALKVPALFANEWLYIPHIYQSPFYCYAYAFGNLLVLALYRMYENQGQAAVDKILKILAYGGSKSPADILQEVGIDITTQEFWQSGFDVITELIEELRKLHP
jgi:oligoendopeptidase F